MMYSFYPDFLNQRKYVVADHAYFTAGVSVKNASANSCHPNSMGLFGLCQAFRIVEKSSSKSSRQKTCAKKKKKKKRGEIREGKGREL